MHFFSSHPISHYHPWHLRQQQSRLSVVFWCPETTNTDRWKWKIIKTALLCISIYIYVCCYCFRNKTKSQRGFFTTHYITAFVDIFLIYLWTHLYKQTAHKWIFVYINTTYWLCCIYFTHVELANTTNNDACYFFVHALA